jgi:hypothetical protein
MPLHGADKSTTPFDSPSLQHLEALEGIPEYVHSFADADIRIMLGGGDFAAQFMMHQTSQQTVVPRNMFPPAGGLQYLPTFDVDEDEMKDTLESLTHGLEQTHPFHVPPPDIHNSNSLDSIFAPRETRSPLLILLF